MGKNAFMSLTVIGGHLSLDSKEFLELNKYCVEQGLDLTVEWINGQYWLHSDEAKERPIGVEIDRELERHAEYFKRASVLKELLARAVGVKSGARPKILDLTGGLLGDTLLFLSFGCDVITLERHPVISFLIKSALANAQHPALSRLTFISSDALTYLEQNPNVDVIYFDPMFEDPSGKALPKKKMRIFRSLIGPDADAIKVFELAMSWRPKRLIVKRPRLSIELKMAPSVKFEGKATRYDVYFSS